MKEKLAILAKEIGFESKFFSSSPYKYSSNEDLRYFLWMTELQKYLNDNFDIFIYVDVDLNDVYNSKEKKTTNTNYFFSIKQRGKEEIYSDNEDNYFISNIESLEEGLKEAFKLIK